MPDSPEMHPFTTRGALLRSALRGGLPCRLLVRSALLILVISLMATSATFATAGTIDVVVREQDGQTLAGVRVDLLPSDDERESRWSLRRQAEISDQNGRVRFNVRNPGQYTFQLRGLDDPALVRPADNPYAPLPVVTLADTDEKIAVEIVLWRGGPVACLVRIDRWDLPRARVTFASRETGQEIVAAVGPSGEVERTLPPGRWTVSLALPAGFLVTGLDESGRTLPGHEVTVQVERAVRPIYITWQVTAGAKITGTVDTVGDEGPLVIAATLDEPGAWHAAALERGGSRFEVVRGGIREGEFEIIVPDGRWTVRPQGERLDSSVPEEAALQLAPGDERQLQFTVRHRDADGSRTLVVQVSAPDRRALEGALVKVWSGTSPGKDENAIAKKTDKRGRAYFYDLAGAAHAIVAGHVDHREARAKISERPEDDDEATWVSVKLREAATIHAVAEEREDGSTAPASDVELIVERIDEPPGTLLNDPALDAMKSHRIASTDDTGHVEITGFYAGAHLLKGRLEGSRARTRFVRIDDDGKSALEAEVDLAIGETRDVELKVLPAASVSGTLACDDDSPLPASASFRVFPFEKTHTDRREDPDLIDGAVLALDDVTLTGPYTDEFLIGPLEPDAYHVAVRPSGHSLWTWVIGSESRRRAAIVDASLGAPSGVGLIKMFCGPLIEIVPRARSGQPLPDSWSVRFTAEAVVKEEDGTERSFEPRITVLEDRVRLGGLTEGEAEVTISAEHPHFLPAPVQAWTVEGRTKRGGLLEIPVPIEAIGGALIVTTSLPAVRLGDPQGGYDVKRTTDGQVEFMSLPPGDYVAELCVDPTCDSTPATTKPIRIEAGSTVELDLGSASSVDQPPAP